MILDNEGVAWVVDAGDPARDMVNHLHAVGFEYIVLPRTTLTLGYPSGIMEDTPESVTERTHYLRMLDCVEVIRQGYQPPKKKDKA